MRKSIKRLWTTILLVCMLVCMGAAFAACKEDDEPTNIEITEEAMRDTVVLGQEFDMLSVVENYDADLTYKITELYYLDNTFEMHDIAFTGTKFTLSEPYNVYATLAAYKGDKMLAEEEFVLKYEILSNTVSDAFLLAWNDMGVSKSLNANAAYKYGDATHSIKAKYISSSQGKPCLGQIKKSDGFSVNNWENAVFKVDVYNPQQEDFIITLHIQKGSYSYVAPFITMKGEEFTHAAWSLHRMGHASNILSDGYAINVRVAPVATKSDYNYVLYLSNLDIVDYSETAFPDMEYRTDEEIAAEQYDQIKDLPGEMIDKQLTTYYIPDGTKDVDFMAGTGEVSYKNYEGSTLTKPEGLTSLSYLQYDINNSVRAMDSGNYHGYAIAFNNEIENVNVVKKMRDQLFNELSVSNWENAYVGFWVYNDSAYELKMYAQYHVNFSTSSGATADVPQGSWKYVEWKLQDFGYSENPFSLTSYFLRVGFGFRNTGITTLGDFTAKFYIDGFDIYNKAGEKPDSQKTQDELLADHYIPDDRTELDFMHAVGAVSVQNVAGSALTMPADFAGTSYLQYDITNESTLASGNYHGFAIAIDNKQYAKSMPIKEALLSKFNVSDWSNAYMGFWVYHNSNYTLNIYGQNSVNFSTSTGPVVESVAKGTWTYIEWKLTEFDASYTTNPFLREAGKDTGYFFRVGFGFRGTGITTVGGLNETFYIAGFDIYDKSSGSQEPPAVNPDDETTVNELLVDHYIPDGKVDKVEYMAATGSVEVKTFTTLTKPDNSVGNDYLAYTIGNETAIATGNYHGYALAFNNANATTKIPMTDELLAKFSVSDWSNAYVGFWVYNDSNYKLNIYAQHELNFSTAPETKSVETTKGGWKYVEFKLSDFGYTENPFELESYFLRIGFGFRGTGITTADTLNASFYLTGFDIYNGSKTVV